MNGFGTEVEGRKALTLETWGILEHNGNDGGELQEVMRPSEECRPHSQKQREIGGRRDGQVEGRGEQNTQDAHAPRGVKLSRRKELKTKDYADLTKDNRLRC